MPEAMSPEVKAALEECRWMITKGSKSFSLAARLFDSDTRDAAFFLYGWCRYCDDQVDQAGLTDSREQLVERLAELSEATRSIFSGAQQKHAVFIAMQYIVQRHSIPAHYALELIEGMAMDARGTRYQTFDDLSLYCYRVAGTVGLMMSHVMGLRGEQALKHAADLGIAMQLTNIARYYRRCIDGENLFAFGMDRRSRYSAGRDRRAEESRDVGADYEATTSRSGPLLSFRRCRLVALVVSFGVRCGGGAACLCRDRFASLA
jgi:phytoene/squalene synthetase